MSMSMSINMSMSMHYKKVLLVTKDIDRYDPGIEKGSYRGLYEGLRREFLRNEACLAS